MRLVKAISLTMTTLALLLGASTTAQDVDVEKCGLDESCVDKQLVGIIDKFDRVESVPLFGGLEVVKTAEELPESGTKEGGDELVDRVRRFVVGHDLRYRAEAATGRSMDGDARSSKMKKLLLPLLLALKVKMIIVMSVVLTALKLISIKGVFAGLFALFLSGITALKSFGETKHEPLTAILATPVHSLSTHHHDHVKWGRQDAISAVDPASSIVQQLPADVAYGVAASPYHSPYAHHGMQLNR